MRILILTIGEAQGASSLYRFGQFAPFFRDAGVQADYLHKDEFDGNPAVLRGYDWIINQKCLLGGRRARAVLNAPARLWFDFDDAIYTRPGKPYGLLTSWRVRFRLARWLRRPAVVTTSSEFLAGYARKFRDGVRVVPMSLNLDEWRPRQDAGASGAECIVGWAGSPATRRYLERMDAVLRQVLEKNPDVRLKMFCGEKPALSVPFEYVPYAPGREAEFTRSLDIGLLPLLTEEFAKGKSPIKSVQYLASGIPVVGNIIGASREILSPETSCAVDSPAEWVSAISGLVRDPARRRKMGTAGRAFAEQHHSLKVNGARLLEILGADGGSQEIPIRPA